MIPACHRAALVWCILIASLLSGCGGTQSASADRDKTPPPVPKDLVAFARGGHAIQLLWHSSFEMTGTGTAGYRLFRDGNAQPLATVASPEYLDQSVEPDSKHVYRVLAFDGARNQSGLSNPATIRTPLANATVPATPDRPSVWAADGKVTVSWPAAWDGGAAIQSYVIGASPSLNIIATVLAESRNVVLAASDIPPKGRVAIAARNAVGVSKWSDWSEGISESPVQPARFPLHYSGNRRYLVDQSDMPFPILGRTAWFILALSEMDQSHFLNDTLAKEFNSIELYALTHDRRGLNPPRNGNGDLPFTRTVRGAPWDGDLDPSRYPSNAPDMTSPNQAYWGRIDRLLSFCESHGVLVFLFPGYAGYEGGEQGWMREMVANGPSRMRVFGAWVARRYRERSNIVWMLGGDMGKFNHEQLQAANALLAGMRSVDSQKSVHFSAEWQSESIGTDQPEFGSAITLNSVYSWTGKVVKYGRLAYAHQPAMPAFLLEEPYDEEGPDGTGVNPHAIQPVRRFQWQGWLTTLGGYISGNGYVWPFSDPRWPQHLQSAGANDMALLNRFIHSIPWWELAPTQVELIPAMGAPEPAGGAVATRTQDRTLLVAYVPPMFKGAIRIPPATLTGPLHADWMSPATGDTHVIGEFPGDSALTVVPPSGVKPAQTDWVLILRSLASQPASDRPLIKHPVRAALKRSP